jgi:hypothetical protein
MSSVFYSQEDKEREQRYRVQGDVDREHRRQQSLALRRQHEQANESLRRRLPFQWQGGIRKAKYQGEVFWEQSLPAVHIMLLEPYEAGAGRNLFSRQAGEWLCRSAIDYETGELRYEGEKAPQYADGTGRPGAHYEQQITCKNCLQRAMLLHHHG